MSATPRATPVVPPPHHGSAKNSPQSPKRLLAPVVVVTAQGEWELERGELLVGRDAEVDIRLSDPLVSRFHARIRVGKNGDVVVEDLHSANGVLVNGAPLLRQNQLLGEGDRILVGTTELSVFGLRASAMVQVNEPPCVAVPESRRTRIAPAERPLGAVALSREVLPRPIALTGRSDATSLVGHYAETLMASGHQAQAIHVLEEHLGNLLKGASVGLTVSAGILDSATAYALKLYTWTKSHEWLTYGLDLHLASQSIPSDQTLEALAHYGTQIERREPGTLAGFLSSVAPRLATLSDDERARMRSFEIWAESLGASAPDSKRP